MVLYRDQNYLENLPCPVHSALNDPRGFVERSFDLSISADAGFIVELRVRHLAADKSSCYFSPLIYNFILRGLNLLASEAIEGV